MGVIQMVRNWLVGLVLVAGAAACTSDEGASGPAPNDVQIVAAEDGTVEVIAGGRTIFAMAATGPVARTFTEQWFGAGVISFVRDDEVADPMSVQEVVNEGNSVRVEYASGSRSATLTAIALNEEVSDFKLEVAGEEANSIAVGIRCDEGGTFHGFGEQYNATNQRARSSSCS